MQGATAPCDDIRLYWREHEGLAFHSEGEPLTPSKRYVLWTAEEAVSHAWHFPWWELGPKRHRNLIPSGRVGDFWLCGCWLGSES